MTASEMPGFLPFELAACTAARSRSAFRSSVTVVGDRAPPRSLERAVEDRPGGVRVSGAGRVEKLGVWRKPRFDVDLLFGR
jgi:hypothetical protein